MNTTSATDSLAAKSIWIGIVSIITASIWNQNVFCQSQPDQKNDRFILWTYNREIEENQIIDGGAINGAYVSASKAPKGAVPEGLIAVGRKALRHVGRGEPVLFSDCLAPAELGFADQINNLNILFPEPKESAATTPYESRAVRTLCCRRDIKTGHVLGLADIKFENTLEMKLPATRAYDIWTVLGREARRDLKAGDGVQLEDFMFPEHIRRLYFPD
ncbi:hypothetical protein BH10CYA1_BH10CYA1_59150 [soil metagenome]